MLRKLVSTFLLTYYGTVISRLWCRDSTVWGSNISEYPIDMCCLMTALHPCSSSCGSFFWNGRYDEDDTLGRGMHPWTDFTTSVSSFVNNLLISVSCMQLLPSGHLRQ